MTMHVAIVADLGAEQWPSMDLVADELADNLPRVTPEIRTALLRPPFASRPGLQVARYKARYRDYPAWLAARREDFDIFHVVDHSYAHVVHRLPAERSVVTCHDIDAFRCLPPLNQPAPLLYRRIAPRVLEGLRRAARVTCDSEATRRELVSAGWLDPSRCSVVPNGVHPAFLQEPDAAAVTEVFRLVGPAAHTELLHVGSTIPRKEIEFLLQLFAMLHARDQDLRLIQAGGELTRAQRAIADRLGVAHAITVVPRVPARVLAALYRRASVVLLPSSREGFGLPVIEALACGTPLVVTDLPVLREVGDDVPVYAPVHDIFQWAAAVQRMLDDRRSGDPQLADRIRRGKARADRFSWRQYAEQMAMLYRDVLAAAGLGVRQ